MSLVKEGCIAEPAMVSSHGTAAVTAALVTPERTQQEECVDTYERHTKTYSTEL